ncbi:MAG: hypothetical protein RhofKO_33860 [Rhodothermales bacterium]
MLLLLFGLSGLTAGELRDWPTYLFVARTARLGVTEYTGVEAVVASLRYVLIGVTGLVWAFSHDAVLNAAWQIIRFVFTLIVMAYVFYSYVALI